MIYIIGANKTGNSIFKYFKDRNLKSTFCLTYDSHLYENINKIDILPDDEIYISPGVSPSSLSNKIKNHGVKTDLDIFMNEISDSVTVICVTGTNGKTSVVSGVGNYLSSQGLHCCVCGNIGLPVLLTLDKKYDVYIIELSSFQLHYSSITRSNISCLINFYPLQHSLWHGSHDEYLYSKCKIFKNSNTIFIYNTDNKLALRLIKDNYFSKYDHLYISYEKQAKNTYSNINGKIFYENEFIVEEEKHTFNTNAILAILHAFKKYINDNITIDINKIKIACPEMPHRLEHVGKIQDIIYINNSKSTNVTAWINCIIRYPNSIFISGGFINDSSNIKYDQSALEILNEYKKKDPKTIDSIKAVICFGESALYMYGVCKSMNIKTVIVDNMEDAIITSIGLSDDLENEYVVLNPGFPSYGLYSSYIERGDHFKEIVKKYQSSEMFQYLDENNK